MIWYGVCGWQMTPKIPVQPMGNIDAPIQRGLSLSYILH